MIGASDFIGYFDWTFEYLRATVGEDGVQAFFATTLAHECNADALELFRARGLQGMAEYWGYAFGLGPRARLTATYFSFQMDGCPSLCFLLERGKPAYHDFCEHCMGWVGAVAGETGFLVDHEHNHHGECWWRLRIDGSKPLSQAPAPEEDPGDVRLSTQWARGKHHLWVDSRRLRESGE